MTTKISIALLVLLHLYVSPSSAGGHIDEIGFDFQYRLPPDWQPISYRLKIFYEESSVTVPAELRLKIMAQRPTQNLTLHAFAPSISIQETTVVSLNSEEISTKLSQPITTQETVTYMLPSGIYKKLDYGSLMEVLINYTFTVNETDMHGAFRDRSASFRAQNLEPNASRADLFTKFEPFYARRLLPCFDEPEYKALFYLDRFVLYRKTSFKAIVLFNTHGELLQRSSDKEIWTFPKPSPKMPVYLLAIFVGSFSKFYTTGPLGGTPPKVTIWYKKDVEITESTLQSRRVLGYYEQLFDVNCPIEKFDIVFVPYGPSGMENWGLIAMKTGFTLTGDIARWSGEQTLVHELLHQWFGNMITCKWWTDIWINEGLTSFYTYKYLEGVFKPSTNRLKIARSEVLDRDADTNATELMTIRLKRFGRNWWRAYDKAPWVLKMLEQVLGEELFLEGIKSLLKHYSFQPVTSDDFFRVFQREVDNKGLKGWNPEENLDMRQFLYNWLFEHGHPQVTASWDSQSKSFTLSQGKSVFNGDPDLSSTEWYVPIWFNRTDHGEGWISKTFWIKPKQNLVLGSEEGIPGDPKLVQWDPKVVGFYKVVTENVD